VLPNIDWRAIKPDKGTQNGGFESLSVLLADAEVPSRIEFTRNAPPDGGVECFATLSNGTEHGWQAKYVFQLESVQWQEIDKSVLRAIATHPNLVRYYVCLPMDLPDPRTPGRLSARDKWGSFKEKWLGVAAESGRTIEFIYWGDHELRSRLLVPGHAGLLVYFFDKAVFTKDWFARKFESAKSDAGPRYTPEVHVDLPISERFNEFGRTPQFFDSLKSTLTEIRKALKSIHFGEDPDTPFTTQAKALREKMEALIGRIRNISYAPNGALDFEPAVREAETALSNLYRFAETLDDTRRQHARSPTGAPGASVDYAYHNAIRLVSSVSELIAQLKSALRYAAPNLLILTGSAGSGKTHLLCDITRNRLAAHRPTVLLMGQRFNNADTPWVQILQQLDEAALKAEEFVAALETSAKVNNARALVLIDALNETRGRSLWHDGLSSFLQPLLKSPWIAVVLAVRDSYLERLIPEEVRKQAATLDHEGFGDHSYDAMRAYFEHYDLEVPSALPLLPEFRNPLFLKELCKGLSDSGQTRLPRGSLGITEIFDQRLSSLNYKLAKEDSLNFDESRHLVTKALLALAREMVRQERADLDRDCARKIVNDVLPGRTEDSRTLFYGLEKEQILFDLPGWTREDPDRVTISYERLKDHLVARELLTQHFDKANPNAAFGDNGTLAFIANDRHPLWSAGLLEAIWIQVAETAHRELEFLCPAVRELYEAKERFLSSLAWRTPAAVTERATQTLRNWLSAKADDRHLTITTLLNLCGIPEHPLNASFLDQWLRGLSMPERDAVWTTYLHSAWSENGPVSRLIDWAAHTVDATLEGEVVDLVATTLTWMLTASNRFVRDRATVGLVRILSGRIASTTKLVEGFHSVDDPYIVERVMAVAYGVAMREPEGSRLAPLAQCVYQRIFAKGEPPPQILLRDYARGVVERAIYLGAQLDCDASLIRPPYRSSWPSIPTQEEVDKLYEVSDQPLKWIHSSIFHNDFGRYVIGTNSWSTDWLAVPLSDPPWTSAQEHLETFVAALPSRSQIAWAGYKEAQRANVEVMIDLPGGARPMRLVHPDVRKMARNARARLRRRLSREQAEVLFFLENKVNQRQTEPGFDLRLIQRYVFVRVAELGYTTERFGTFDRYIDHGGGSSGTKKAERIGKKYQWIAYREICALVADHFQYRKRWSDQSEYRGPWQNHFRDIDPSCCLESKPKFTDEQRSASIWWSSVKYEAWDKSDPTAWVRTADLPDIRALLLPPTQYDGSQWINEGGYYEWKPRLAAGEDESGIRCEVWVGCKGYLVRQCDLDALTAWASKQSFWNNWMPEGHANSQACLGEYGWTEVGETTPGWARPEHSCPVEVLPLAFDQTAGGHTFDCAVDGSYNVTMPVSELRSALDLKWTGEPGEFTDAQGSRIAFDPSVFEPGRSALLLRREAMEAYMKREKLNLFWTVIACKQAYDFETHRHAMGSRHRFSGSYTLAGDGTLRGVVREDPD
jgi:hypothetical protein